MAKSRVAVLVSGGIDSDILVAHLLDRYDEVHPIYVRSGFVWEKAELFWLKKYLKAVRQKNLMPLKVLEAPAADILSGWAVTGRGAPGYRSPDDAVFLPGRNLLLLAKAVTYGAMKKIHRIALGTLASNPFPDATPRFFRSFERTAEAALDFPVRVLTPFARFKKKDLMKKSRGLPLHLSFSCLNPVGTRRCGRCNKCAETETCQSHPRSL